MAMTKVQIKVSDNDTKTLFNNKTGIFHKILLFNNSNTTCDYKIYTDADNDDNKITWFESSISSKETLILKPEILLSNETIKIKCSQETHINAQVLEN